jgi:hypothetical protein
MPSPCHSMTPHTHKYSIHQLQLCVFGQVKVVGTNHSQALVTVEEYTPIDTYVAPYLQKEH